MRLPILPILALTLAASLSPSCKDPASAHPALGRVTWSSTRAAKNPPARELFEEVARRAVSKMPAPATGVPLSVDVQGIYDRSDNEALAILTGRVEGVQRGVRLEAKVVAKATLGEEFDARALLESGMGDLARALGAMSEIATGGEEAWLRALQSAEPDEQILGIRLLGRKRVKGAAERLAALMSDPREQVAEEAAEALARTGEPGDVPLIIESIGKGDLRSEVRAIETMGKIGGAEARAYLEMTAFGHEVPEVRRVSADALKRMKSL